MTRLPAPSTLVPAHAGRLLGPLSAHRPRFAPVTYRPITPRPRQRTTAQEHAKTAAVPHGYVTAAEYASRHGLPEALVQLRAIHQPELLPAQVRVAGQLFVAQVGRGGLS